MFRPVPLHLFTSSLALCAATLTGSVWADESAPPAEAPATAAAPAEEAPAKPPFGTLGDGSPPDSFFESLGKGKFNLNTRFRYEYADARGLPQSNAVTLRNRLGYGTAPYNGLSLYLEGEYTLAIGRNNYDPNRIENIPRRTFVSDPDNIEVNQAYVKYDSDLLDWDSTFIGGRQRIILDDSRFIGNVGWRQNEQTFDAVKTSTDFNIDGFEAIYGYIWQVNRIFGDQKQWGLVPTGSATRDFNSDSHIVNLSYDKLPIGKLTGFAYLLDLERKGDNVAVFSTNTFGLRLSGKQELDDTFSLGYNLSYAYQVDSGNNPRDLAADYYLAEGSLIVKNLGNFTVGYEVLGADGPTQAFSTPLATLHKFQGWSDVLLVPSLTGGPIGTGAGIRDLYFSFAPAQLPWGLKGKAVYHYFETDSGGLDIGHEIDAALTKKIDNNWSVTVKYAHFFAEDVFVDTSRLWFDVTFKF